MSTPDAFSPPRPHPLLLLTGLAILLALLALGFAFGREGAHYATLAARANTFSPTPALITGNGLRQESRNHLPDVRFSYTIQGKSYEGSNFYNARAFRDNKLASRESGRYKINQEVTVFVDPQDPKTALLTRDVNMVEGGLRLGFGALCLGAAIAAAIGMWRAYKRSIAMAYGRYLLAQGKATRQAERERHAHKRRQPAPNKPDLSEPGEHVTS